MMNKDNGNKMNKGYVYILTNPCIRSLKGKKVVKVGYTKDLPRRLGTLNTSVPENFKVDVLFEVDNYKSLELWAKGYVGDSLRTAEGSPTEFFEQSADIVKNRILKCCRHHGIKPIQLDGSIYIGRSASAIRTNLKDRNKVNTKNPIHKPTGCFPSMAELGRHILTTVGKDGKTNGHVMNILRKQTPCHKTSKWREPIESLGIQFDANDFIRDWKCAKA